MTDFYLAADVLKQLIQVSVYLFILNKYWKDVCPKSKMNLLSGGKEVLKKLKPNLKMMLTQVQICIFKQKLMFIWSYLI